MDPKITLRAEGLTFFVAATLAYFALEGPLWLFLALALAPDLSMLGYLAGPRIGSSIYNAFHTYLVPVTLGGVAVWIGVTFLSWVALVWIAHVGMDRAVGYGLKYPTGFKHTHLSGETVHRAAGVDAGSGTEPVGAGGGR